MTNKAAQTNNVNYWFSPMDASEKNDEFIAVDSKTFLVDAWDRFKKNKRAVFGLTVILVIILIAIFGPVFSPFSFDEIDPSNMNQLPNLTHLMGTDKLGRDAFVRMCYGARISLFVGFGSSILNLIIGVIYGGISGYIGGKTDMILMRIVDILYSIPSLLYVILIMLVMGPNVFSMLIGICIAGWIGMARQVRGQIIALKEREYSMAALVLGASDGRIVFRHLMVNAAGPIIVQLTFMVPLAIFTEAFLSFVGVGISAPMASWGTMAQLARPYILTQPLQVLFPSLAICLTIFALNFLGEGLGDALNPKKK